MRVDAGGAASGPVDPVEIRKSDALYPARPGLVYLRVRVVQVVLYDSFLAFDTGIVLVINPQSTGRAAAEDIPVEVIPVIGSHRHVYAVV